MLASPVRTGRTTIVGKKPVVILGRKKAVAIAVRNMSGGGDGRSCRSGSIRTPNIASVRNGVDAKWAYGPRGFLWASFLLHWQRRRFLLDLPAEERRDAPHGDAPVRLLRRLGRDL